MGRRPGRPTIGERAMTGSERVRRYRERHGKPAVKPATDAPHAEEWEPERARLQARIAALEAKLRASEAEVTRLQVELVGAKSRINDRTNDGKGVWPKATYSKILSCLHSDSRNSTSDKKLTEAFLIFKEAEALLVEDAATTEKRERDERWKAERDAHFETMRAGRARYDAENRARARKAAETRKRNAEAKAKEKADSAQKADR